MLPGYPPTDRPKTEGELPTGLPYVLDDEVRKSSGKGAWIALAVVVLVVLGMILLLTTMPDAATSSTTVPLPPDAPAG